MTEEVITCTRDTTIDILGDAIKDDTIYNVIDDQTTINIFDKIWPIGSLYFGTMETCPLAVLFGTWEKVSAGKVIQGSDTNHLAGTTIEAGLPNITGSFNMADSSSTSNRLAGWKVSGVFSKSDLTYSDLCGAGSGTGTNANGKVNFDASQANSIYGNSDTVQPAAFVVNIWQRTA